MLQFGVLILTAISVARGFTPTSYSAASRTGFGEWHGQKSIGTSQQQWTRFGLPRGSKFDTSSRYGDYYGKAQLVRMSAEKSVDGSGAADEPTNAHNNNEELQNVASDASELAHNNDTAAASAVASTAESKVASTAASTVPSKKKTNFFLDLVKSNWLVLGEIFVILLAKYNPSLGATGGPLRPELTISKMGVFTIFFINGVALSLGGGSRAEVTTATKTNILIQGFNFGFIPLTAKLLARFYPEPAFRDGLLVLSCLPGTINICVAQTLAAGGNMGTAIFNAIFANVLGVFLTPLLAIYVLGAGRGVSLLSTLKKLGNVVILPLVIGQIARRTPVGAFFQRISKYSRTLSSCLLLAIVYNVFSDTFTSGIGVAGGALLNLTMTMPVVYMAYSAIFWFVSKRVLPGLDAPTRTAALLCSSQKTLAFGIPFIKTALGTRPDIAYILAPLLLYAPAQLLLGSSILVPALRDLIKKQADFEDGGGI